MEVQIYTIMDELVGNYKENLMVFKSDGEAQRTFSIIVNDTRSGLINTNPGDFALWRIAKLNTNTGEVIADLEKIVNGRSVKTE